MANKRSIKKDIRYMTELLIRDALYVSEIKAKKKDKTDGIILEALYMHNELIARVNHPDGKDNPILVKKHYKKITEDLLQRTDELFNKLYQLVE